MGSLPPPNTTIDRDDEETIFQSSHREWAEDQEAEETRARRAGRSAISANEAEAKGLALAPAQQRLLRFSLRLRHRQIDSRLHHCFGLQSFPSVRLAKDIFHKIPFKFLNNRIAYFQNQIPSPNGRILLFTTW